ncbi:ABC transporter ATP-binding protein [Pseudonocardia sp. WMMC193]|uniref:ABC transporter ATP-binding protein n=1 Tax=Pseudonocardia sp. WMMC193 TaxID=2911965 RepID=UPI001F4507C2|nr:ABC transporter ATP-binding protein [Pseudonocardia sp. WMMC193]MCF7547533.1 ABC transporter ATP-binding protein [Pseudonocardia sp. WMMC193]
MTALLEETGVDTALLAVRGLTVDAGDVRLVDGVDLSLRAGERVALVGESGSGKSVTARALLRLDRGLRLGGSVRLGGTDLLALSDKEMSAVRGRRVGMVFQDPMGALDPLQTIGEQVAEPLRLRGLRRREAHERARALLDDLGVDRAAERMRAYPHEFSGGMRQRVVLAMALIGEPEVLVADEPTTALDVRVQAQVLRLLDTVCAERGLGVLLITHDLGVVAGFAERVVVMYAGRAVEAQPIRPLYAAPAHPYTAGLLRAVPRVDRLGERLEPIPGAPPSPAARPGGCAFHPRCPVALDRCATEVPAWTGVAACHLLEES